jgi:hypothetical protein
MEINRRQAKVRKPWGLDATAAILSSSTLPSADWFHQWLPSFLGVLKSVSRSLSAESMDKTLVPGKNQGQPPQGVLTQQQPTPLAQVPIPIQKVQGAQQQQQQIGAAAQGAPKNPSKNQK